jgi:hypothetical protein
VAWISIGEAASALVADVDAVRELVAAGVLSCIAGSDRRLMLDPDEVRELLLGRRAPAPFTIPPPEPDDTGPVSTSDAPDGSNDPERSVEEILAGEGDVVERGRLAARVILALEDEIDALTALVRDAAVELTKRGATSPEIAEELGISSAAVVRLLTGLPVMGEDLPRSVPLDGETITVPVAERWSKAPEGDDASVLVGVGGQESDEAGDDDPVGGNWDLWRPADEFVAGDDAPELDTLEVIEITEDYDLADLGVEADVVGDVTEESGPEPEREAEAEVVDEPEPEPQREAVDEGPAVFVGPTQIDAALARGCLGTLFLPWRRLPVPEVLRRLFRR